MVCAGCGGGTASSHTLSLPSCNPSNTVVNGVCVTPTSPGQIATGNWEFILHETASPSTSNYYIESRIDSTGTPGTYNDLGGDSTYASFDSSTLTFVGLGAGASGAFTLTVSPGEQVTAITTNPNLGNGAGTITGTASNGGTVINGTFTMGGGNQGGTFTASVVAGNLDEEYSNCQVTPSGCSGTVYTTDVTVADTTGAGPPTITFNSSGSSITTGTYTLSDPTGNSSFFNGATSACFSTCYVWLGTATRTLVIYSGVSQIGTLFVLHQ